MTDIERLRDAINLRFTSGNDVPVERATITRAEWIALLADYERLRGMEERVKGAVVGEWRGCEQSWKAGGSVEVKFRVLDINYHAPMRVALVPVPGGE